MGLPRIPDRRQNVLVLSGRPRFDRDRPSAIRATRRHDRGRTRDLLHHRPPPQVPVRSGSRQKAPFRNPARLASDGLECGRSQEKTTSQEKKLIGRLQLAQDRGCLKRLHTSLAFSFLPFSSRLAAKECRQCAGFGRSQILFESVDSRPQGRRSDWANLGYRSLRGCYRLSR